MLMDKDDVKELQSALEIDDEDFRDEQKKIRQLRKNLWHICYNADYSSFTVKRLGFDDRILSITD